MKRRTRRINPRATTTKRTPRAEPSPRKRVPKRLRALGGVDPRELPPGAPYPCDDPRIGTRAAGDHFAGTVLACAVPPEGKHGRFFVVGGIESGAAISSARSRRERTREALRARWDGPDLDARPARGGRAKAPPPSSLAALPVPEARELAAPRHRRSLPVIQPRTRRRLPVIQPPPKRRALNVPERVQERLYAFAVVPGRAWRVAVWSRGTPMGRAGARERLSFASTLDAVDPEDALSSARELALGAGLITE